jgi:F0F1-type ATP synthase membrane subunit c/vacuolar-type H+-ATPase subunit K
MKELFILVGSTLLTLLGLIGSGIAFGILGAVAYTTFKWLT